MALFRVHYRYVQPDTTRPRQYSILMPATDAEAARRAVAVVMQRDGTPMERIEIMEAVPMGGKS